jgi:2-dehydropantoate 2-reductase
VTALRVAVLGPGGVGGLLGALLADRGAEVTCLARPESAAQIGRAGLRLSSERFGEITALASGAERLDRPVDVVLVTPKATQLEAALDRLPAEAVGTALLVPFLNGVEHLALLRERYPAARTVAGAIQVSAFRTAPGTVRHDGTLARVQLGPGADVLAEALRATGLDVVVRPDDAGVLWGKLCFLAPMALLTTALEAPFGEVRDRRGADLRAIVEEVAAVARAEGAEADAAATLEFARGVPAQMRSSMQRDAEAGHPTELEAIGGAVLRAAERHGIEVPVTRRVVEELRARPAPQQS